MNEQVTLKRSGVSAALHESDKDVGQRPGRRFSRRLTRIGIAHRTAVYALALAVSGCAIVEPYVPMPEVSNQSMNFSEARVVAQKQSAAFAGKLQDLEYFDLATGTFLVGTGIAALAFGIYNAHEDAIFGAALAGGTATAGRAFLPIQDRKEIYQSGTQAISCAIASISLGEPETSGNTGGSPEPARIMGQPAAAITGSAAPASLRQAAARLKSLSGKTIAGLQSRAGLNANTNAGNVTTSAIEFRSAVLTATDPVAKYSGVLAGNRIAIMNSRFADAQSAARDLSAAVDQALDTRSQRLLMATDAIVAAVNKKLVAARITPEDSLQAAVSNFTKTNDDIRSIAKSLTEKAKEAQEKGEDAQEAIMSAGAAGANTPLAAKAVEQQAEIVEKEKIAEDLSDTSSYVLSLIGTSDTCLNGLK
jgi:hypothetical protein